MLGGGLYLTSETQVAHHEKHDVATRFSCCLCAPPNSQAKLNVTSRHLRGDALSITRRYPSSTEPTQQNVNYWDLDLISSQSPKLKLALVLTLSQHLSFHTCDNIVLDACHKPLLHLHPVPAVRGEKAHHLHIERQWLTAVFRESRRAA